MKQWYYVIVRSSSRTSEISWIKIGLELDLKWIRIGLELDFKWIKIGLELD